MDFLLFIGGAVLIITGYRRYRHHRELLFEGRHTNRALRRRVDRHDV